MQNGQPIPKEFGGWCCFFSPFPKPKTQYEKCREWIKKCGRPQSQMNVSTITKNTYICSKVRTSLSYQVIKWAKSSQYCLNIITVLCSQCIYFNVKRDYKILLNVFWHFVKCPTWGQANVIRWPDSPRFSLTKIKTLHCFAGVYMSELIMSRDFISEIWSPHNVIKLADS